MDPMDEASQAFSVFTPSSNITGYDAVYITELYVNVPIFAIGAALSGYVAFVTTLSHKTLLQTRMAYIMQLLILVSFVWSVGAALFPFLEVIGTPLPTIKSRFANFISLMIVLLYILNVALSMERYFMIRSYETSYTNRYYFVLGFCMIVAVAAAEWFQFAAPSLDGLTPSDPIKAAIWTGLVVAGFGLVILLTSALYFVTYRISTTKLADLLTTANAKISDLSDGGSTLASDSPLRRQKRELSRLQYTRVKAERTILWHCCVMSASLLVCYAPLVAYEALMRLIVLTSRDFSHFPYVAWFCMGKTFLALDVIVTPVLVIYFRRDIREAMYIRSLGAPQSA
ncbi:hypothetical protein BC830DRAFT_1116962 [Chytriomyces sp. MP71]|nr:hypothetical protein BC830DRAFT_1116962 [Chytriomyces sp. MP71]